MISRFFKKLSLTQQVLFMILLFIGFFGTFFFFFLSNNIDNTIANQMYMTMSNRQQPIIAYLKSNYPGLDEIYEILGADDIQTNCIVSKSKVTGKTNMTVINPNDLVENDESLLRFIATQADALLESDSDQKEGQGALVSHNEQYYYLMKMVQTYTGITVVQASIMNDSYPQSIRNTLVDSTVYGTILAFCVFIIGMMIWVFSIIHPLNQIKNYIAQVKQGKEVELHLNRNDEIGEVAMELVNMKDELQKQEKVKEEMIHNISHDLKTPIATIKSYSESI